MALKKFGGDTKRLETIEASYLLTSPLMWGGVQQ